MAEVIAVDSGHGFEREPAPIMPHRLCSVEGLDELYPLLRAVEAVDEEDGGKGALLDGGVKVARGIVKQASECGRRRVQREEPVQH